MSDISYMGAYLRNTAGIVVALSMAAGLAACGKAADDAGRSASDRGSFTVGLLLPENEPPRYEMFDKPLIEKKIKELCDGCRVKYANAQGDVARQHLQVDSMITNGVDVLILDTVDPKSLRSAVVKAEEADIPVVSYDNLSEGPVSAFVSFDAPKTGRLQGEALLKALGGRADGSQIIRVEGPRVGPHGGLPVLEKEAEVSKPYKAAAWNAQHAHATMSGAIAAVGPENIDGVLASTDALAAGVISALKAAAIEPLPPVTGQDADLSAVRRLISGEQYMSVYKPYQREADVAAEIAVALGRGEKINNIAKDRVSSPTTKDIPSVLLNPILLTADNIKSTVVKDGMYTIDEICIPKLRPACQEAGLTG